MKKQTKQLILESNSFDEFNGKLKEYSAVECGNIQEVFAKWYFLSHGVYYDVNEYYSRLLGDEIPENMHERDVGTDGIIKHKDGKYSLVQVKFRSDKGFNLRRDCLSGMSLEALALGSELKWIFLFSNTILPPKMISKSEEKYVKYVMYNDLSECNWDLVKNYINEEENASGNLVVGGEIQLRRWQEEALEHVFRDGVKFRRKQVVAACGAGKSIFGMKVIERYYSVLVTVPNLYLLNQWFKAMSVYYPDRNFCLVGSDADISEGEEVPFVLTTDPKEIFEVVEKGYSVVISTYQSLDKVQRMVYEECGVDFDLAICDEAHVCNWGGGNFSMPLEEDFFAKNVLFVTATPRIYKNARGNQELSMDNEEIFGDRYSYSFRQGIEDGILSDYKIVVGYDETHDDKKYDVDLFHANFIKKSVEENKIKSLIVFSSSHAQSRKLYHHTITLFGKESGYELILMPMNANSRHKARVTNKVNSGEKVIVFNVRVFSLGADIPRLEAVMLAGGKNSVTEIVQTVSRCLRKHKDKKIAYVLLPCLIKELNIESEGEWSGLRSIIAALGSVDEQLKDEITNVEKIERMINTFRVVGTGNSGNIQLFEKDFGIVMFDRFCNHPEFSKEMRLKLLLEFCKKECRLPKDKERYKDVNIGSFLYTLLSRQNEPKWLLKIKNINDEINDEIERRLSIYKKK